jgi:hypothetical protein
MSNQTEIKIQQCEDVTPIEASNNMIEELCEESLEGIAGGVLGQGHVTQAVAFVKQTVPMVMDRVSSFTKFFK